MRHGREPAARDGRDRRRARAQVAAIPCPICCGRDCKEWAVPSSRMAFRWIEACSPWMRHLSTYHRGPTIGSRQCPLRVCAVERRRSSGCEAHPANAHDGLQEVMDDLEAAAGIDWCPDGPRRDAEGASKDSLPFATGPSLGERIRSRTLRDWCRDGVARIHTPKCRSTPSRTASPFRWRSAASAMSDPHSSSRSRCASIAARSCPPAERSGGSRHA